MRVREAEGSGRGGGCWNWITMVTSITFLFPFIPLSLTHERKWVSKRRRRFDRHLFLTPARQQRHHWLDKDLVTVLLPCFILQHRKAIMLMVHSSLLQAIEEHYWSIFMHTLTQCKFHLLSFSAVLPREASWESGDAVSSRRATFDRNVAAAGRPALGDSAEVYMYGWGSADLTAENRENVYLNTFGWGSKVSRFLTALAFLNMQYWRGIIQSIFLLTKVLS